MKAIYFIFFTGVMVYLLIAESRFSSQSGNLIFDPGLDQNKALILDLSGKIGLGITPTESLDVSGNAEVIGRLIATAAEISGSIKTGYQLINSDITLSDTSTILVDSSASSVVVQVPDASTYAGTYYHIVNLTADHPVTVLSSPGLMDGVHEVSLNQDSKSSELQLLSNGTFWSIVGLSGNVTMGSRPFILEIQTDLAGSSASNQFKLPLNASYSYNFSIDWGDGTVESYNTNSDITHTYSSAGTYFVEILENEPGGFPAIYFNNTGDRQKVLALANWGSGTWSTFFRAFLGCSNMVISATDQLTAKTGAVSDFKNAWKDCSSLTSFPKIDTSSATDFTGAWYGCTSLTSFPALDTSNVTDFIDTWRQCNSLTSFPLIDTSSGINFGSAWRACQLLEDFPQLDFSNATGFFFAFSSCLALTELPELNFSSLATGSSMFNNVTLSTNTYSNLLIYLAANNSESNVTFDGGNSKYSISGQAARNILLGRGWAITDGGLDLNIDPNSFQLVVDTDKAGSSSNLQFTLPLNSGKTYDFTVSWGDGSVDTITTTSSPTHTYSTNGIYTVQIAENVDLGFPAIYFNNSGDRQKVLELANWGSGNWSSFKNAFWGCQNMDITAADEVSANTGSVTDFSNAFYGCSSIIEFPLIDTSSATTFNSTWRDCTSMTSMALLNSSNVTQFGSSWYNCTSLSSFPQMDTSTGYSFKWSWFNCDALTTFPVLDFSSTTILEATWYGCNGLLSFPLIDISHVTDLKSAWHGCTSLTNFPLLDTSMVTSFNATWDGCGSLSDFPLLDMSSGNNFWSTWRVMGSLTELPALDLSNLDNGVNALGGVTLSTNNYNDLLIRLAETNSSTNVIFNGGGSKYNLTAVAARQQLVDNGWSITDGGFESSGNILPEAFALVIDTTQSGTTASNQFSLPLRTGYDYNFTIDWGDGSTNVITDNVQLTHTYASSGNYTVQIVENVTSGFPTMYFHGVGDRAKVMELANWGDVTWTTMRSAFQGCVNMEITATDHATANTGLADSVYAAFTDCSSMTTFPLIDTSSATSFRLAWSGCSSLTSFPLIDTSNASSFQQTWRNCSSLTSFPVIDTSGSPTNFNEAWSGCSNLTTFPNIDISNGTNLGRAWKNCSSLSTFPALDFSNANRIDEAWSGCSSLISFPLVDLSNVSNFLSAWSNCMGLNGYDFPSISMTNMTDGDSTFSSVTLSTNSYSSLLVNLAANNSNANIIFDGGNSKYDLSAVAARETLVNNGWSITDGGFESSGNILPDAFALVVDTTQSGTSSNVQFTLPLKSTESYDFVIDWGDHSANVITSNSDLTHTYSSSGNYTIQIIENSDLGFPAIYFNNTGDRQKVLELANWGDVTWSTFENAFFGCSNMDISASDHVTANTGSVTDFANAWNNCSGILTFPMIDTSSGTIFAATWNGCSSLTSFPMLDTSSGTNFSNAWQSCSALTSFPLLDTSSGTEFISTWANCTGLNTSDFPLLNFQLMQDGSSSFDNVTLSTNSYSSLLVNLAANNSNDNVIFDGGNSKALISGNVAGSKLTSRGWVITDGGHDPAFDPQAFSLVVDTTLPGSASDRFKLSTYTGLSYDYTISWGDGSLETYANDSIQTHIYPSSGNYTIQIVENVVAGFPSLRNNGFNDYLKIIELANWGTGTWTTFEDMFDGCNNMEITATDHATAKTGGVESFYHAFRYCSSMTSFPPIDTSSGKSFQATWRNCSSLDGFDFPLLNMHQMTGGGSMFQGVALSTTSWSNLLIDLAANHVNNGVTINGGNSKHNAAGTAAISTLSSSGWSVLDGGLE